MFVKLAHTSLRREPSPATTNKPGPPTVAAKFQQGRGARKLAAPNMPGPLAMKHARPASPRPRDRHASRGPSIVLYNQFTLLRALLCYTAHFCQQLKRCKTYNLDAPNWPGPPVANMPGPHTNER